MIKNLGLSFIFLLCSYHPLLAISARPGARELHQPDGTKFKAEQKGDEWFNWIETEKKFPVVKNVKSGFYEYAQIERGSLTSSGLRVGKELPIRILSTQDGTFQSFSIKSRELKLERTAPSKLQATESSKLGAPQAAAMVGSQKVLAILVDFSNRSLTYSESEWATKFFGATNSVQHYYKEISYGKLNLQAAAETNGTANNGIVTITLNYAHPNIAGDFYGENINKLQKLVKDSIVASDAYVDFSSFDTDNNGAITENELHIVILPAGYEAAYSDDSPSIWAHRWALFSPPTLDGKKVAGGSNSGYSLFGEIQGDHSATIGVIVHELGHDLGLPDLYDLSSPSAGVGSWDVMASGAWQGETVAGDTPSHMSAWCKYYLGWVSPYKISHSSSNAILGQTETGNGKENFVKQLLSNPNGAEMDGTGEYFLIENRQKVGYDKHLTASGILVWHIDESMNTNVNTDWTNRKLVKLVAADNSFGSEAGDPYPGSSNNRTFNNSTSPNNKLYNGNTSNISVSNISNSGEVMSADFNPPQPKLTLSVSSLTFTQEDNGNITAKTFKISNTGDSDSTLYWKVTSTQSWISISSASGTLEKGSEIQITVTADNSGINAGNYIGSVTVNDLYISSLQETLVVRLNAQDSTPPGKPLAIVSKTHPNPNKIYSEPKPEFTLTGPEDPSGIAGYYWKVDNVTGTIPTSQDNYSNKTTIAITSSLEDGSWYFHAVAKDGAGNVGSLAYHQQFIIKTSIDISQENTFETRDGVTVEIPPGTLPNSTQISIEKKTSAPVQTDSRIKETKIYQEIKLADGTRTFNKEVTVTIPYTASDVEGLNEKELRLFYYDESESKWKLIENSSVDTVNKKVTGKVNHFTLFSAMQYAQYAESISNTILIYPNPYRPALSSHLASGILITGTPAYSDLKIYTLSGELVKQLKDENGDGTIQWNAKNENGDSVASGVYFAYLHDAGKTKLLKLAIQR